MRRLFCSLACICLIGLLDAEPQVTYLGDGRYACRGTIRECQSIQRRNDAREFERLQSQRFGIQEREQQQPRQRKPMVDEKLRSEKKLSR